MMMYLIDICVIKYTLGLLLLFLIRCYNNRKQEDLEDVLQEV